jgi:hypothetical protein
MKRIKFFVFVIALCSLLPAFLSAQVDTAWVRRYNGPGNSDDQASSLAIDGQGNVYVTGYSYGSSGGNDYATIKYNTNGIQQWVARYNGPGNGTEFANAIAVDGQCNVFVTGESYGSGTSYDYATVKYNPAGTQQWVVRYNGSGNGADQAHSLTLDGQGNIYVTGESYSSGTNLDYATIKYHPNGDTAWIRRYSGPGICIDIAHAIVVDNMSNVYVTGSSDSFYPTIKYDSSGVQQWTAQYDGVAYSIAVDDSGYIYITGMSYSDYTTVKYNSAGETLWVRRYNGPGNSSDYAKSIAIDGQGNVYVTGGSIGAGTGFDYATVKYNTNGVQQWVARYNGLGNNEDYANSLAIDGQGNVYVTGHSYGSGTSFDYTTIKYNSAGVQQWVARYDGLLHYSDFANAIAVDDSGNVYVTGANGQSATSDYATIKYVQIYPGVEEEYSTLDAIRNTLEVFPDPAHSYVVVRCPSSVTSSEIKIYDATGKMIKGEKFKGLKDERISLDGIKNGVYFVQASPEAILKKLVVTK